MAKAHKTVMIPDELVMNKIYLIRGKKVMIDRDLAELYGVATGNLNLAVKRNQKRFPGDFIFQLTKEEYEDMILQSAISKKQVACSDIGELLFLIKKLEVTNCDIQNSRK